MTQKLMTSLVLAFCLTAASAFYQRPSGEIVQVATECGSPAACFASPLAGGFPLVYIVDSPSTSVLNQLGPEDDFRVLPFAFDLWIYWILIFLSRTVLRESFHPKPMP